MAQTRRFGCFATAINAGVRFGRIDVVGARDVGGDLSGRSEVISVEVKAGRQPFATAAGQAAGYSVYADLCYLADHRPENSFTDTEVAIASRLGVGLVRIGASGRVDEVLSSPLHEPIEGLRLLVLERIGLSLCSLCGVLFRRGDSMSPWRYVVRGNPEMGTGLLKAAREERGFAYWLSEPAARDPLKREYMYHRRYLCRDCVWNLTGDLIEDS